MLFRSCQFAGADGVNKDGDRAYSSYISLAAPFKLAGLDWTAEIGATPWANDFYNVSADPECSGSDGFAVCDISLGVSKEIKITDSFSVPAFAKVTVNPRTEGAYFVLELGLTDNSLNFLHCCTCNLYVPIFLPF